MKILNTNTTESSKNADDLFMNQTDKELIFLWLLEGKDFLIFLRFWSLKFFMARKNVWKIFKQARMKTSIYIFLAAKNWLDLQIC